MFRAYTLRPVGLVACTQGQLWYYNCAALQRAAQLPKNCESPWSCSPTFCLLLGCALQLGVCLWSISGLQLYQYRAVSFVDPDPESLLQMWLLGLTSDQPHHYGLADDHRTVASPAYHHQPWNSLTWGTEFLVIAFLITTDLLDDLNSWLTISCCAWACTAPLAGVRWDMANSSTPS